VGSTQDFRVGVADSFSVSYVGLAANDPTWIFTVEKNTMSDQPASPSPAALEVFEKVVGVSGKQALAQLDDIAPDFAQITIEHGYGGIYAREGLSLRDRELSSISALAAIGGCEGQLRTHLHGALNVGLTAKEITEALIQVSSFAGFPRAINALMVAKEVFREREVSPLR
jgi:4-carboxymuconolactone decarboxylase